MGRILLDLPIEIQQLIYKFYFTGAHAPVRLTWEDWRNPIVIEVTDPRTHLALLRTCKHIYRTTKRHRRTANIRIDARAFTLPYCIDADVNRKELLRDLFNCCKSLAIPECNVTWTDCMPSLRHIKVYYPAEESTTTCTMKQHAAPRGALNRCNRQTIALHWSDDREAALDNLVPKYVTKEVILPVVQTWTSHSHELPFTKCSLVVELRSPDIDNQAVSIAARRFEFWDQWPELADIPPSARHKDVLRAATDLTWYRLDGLEVHNGLGKGLPDLLGRRIDAEASYLRELAGKWMNGDEATILPSRFTSRRRSCAEIA